MGEVANKLREIRLRRDNFLARLDDDERRWLTKAKKQLAERDNG